MKPVGGIKCHAARSYCACLCLHISDSDIFCLYPYLTDFHTHRPEVDMATFVCPFEVAYSRART